MCVCVCVKNVVLLVLFSSVLYFQFCFVLNHVYLIIVELLCFAVNRSYIQTYIPKDSIANNRLIVMFIRSL